ncbi:MAG: glycerol-3-phosphate acyltransferase [Mycoplasmatales bacterium]|nr:glycerol-3-phosphate acyltransferase [Mycoplasmatales bacterium]
MENIIGFNILAFLFAYLIGALNTSIIVSRKMLKEDIRQSGSGNAGATNMARKTGFGGGMLIAFIDWTKVVFTTLIFWILKEKAGHGFETIYIQIVAFGVLVGHIWPIFFKFKGGKGVSAFLGFVMSWNIIAGLIIIIVFWIIVYFVDKISFASMACTLVVVILTFIPWFNNGILTTIMKSGSDIKQVQYWLTPLFATLVSMIVISKHYQNIKRLIKKEESSFRESILKRKPGCKLFKK